jgi:hypothetical protein
MPKSIQPHLPRLLWLYQMGIVLFWVYDRSLNQSRTQLLIDKTLAIVLLGLKVAQLPPLRPLFRPAGELLDTLFGEA